MPENKKQGKLTSACRYFANKLITTTKANCNIWHYIAQKINKLKLAPYGGEQQAKPKFLGAISS